MLKSSRVLLTIILACGGLAFSLACRRSDPGFTRFDLAQRETAHRDSKFRSANNLEHLYHYEINRSGYSTLREKGASSYTVKGVSMQLAAGHAEESVEFAPRLAGPYRLAIDFAYCDAALLALTIEQNGRPICVRPCVGSQNESVDEPVLLARGDRLRIRVTGTGLVALGNPIVYRELPQAKRQYVFIIAPDTLRADHLPTYGYARNTAPNIARFAAGAIQFQRAYSTASWTLPAFASLFTSLYEFNHCVNKEQPLLDTLAYGVEALASRFVCRSINGAGFLNWQNKFNRGFDLYAEQMGTRPSPDAARNLFAQAKADVVRHAFPATFYFLHTYQTHSPFNPKPENLKLFNPAPVFASMEQPTLDQAQLQFRQLQPDAAAQNMRDLYDAEIVELDRWFGDFIDFLKAQGIYDQAMIIFHSDHGEEFYDHLGWGHGHTLFNELIRVPLVVKWPGNAYAHTRVMETVSLVDVMPTIFARYRVDPPKAAIDGVDLLPIITGAPRRDPVFAADTVSPLSDSVNDTYQIALIQREKKIVATIHINPLGPAASRLVTLTPDTIRTLALDQNQLESKRLRGAAEEAEIRRWLPVFKGFAVNAYLRMMRYAKDFGNRTPDAATREMLKTLGYL
jgi:arylsulfatase A-like enzyme